MAIMTQIWSIIASLTLLQLCEGEKSCDIWSSAGPVVKRGTSFKVYCNFKCKCKGSMYSEHPPTRQSHEEFNSSTIYLNVVNISKNPTYSCKCACHPDRDPCGLDISAGYSPQNPTNISCRYNVTTNISGVVFCSWNRGRNSYLRDSSVLWVRTMSGNHTVQPETHNVSSERNGLSSASLPLSSSVERISVWVQVQNRLGSAESIAVNYTLSDLVMPLPPHLGKPHCSSRGCILQVNQFVRTQRLEVQHSADAQTWTSHPDSGLHTSLEEVRSIFSLEPYSFYHFRARSKFSTGHWSPWSSNVSSWTQEEVPAKELDMWFAESSSDVTSLRVYWKEVNMSAARGRIIEYKIRVDSQHSGLVFSANISVDARNHSVPFCADCEVTVWACNSKGLSPPARIRTRHTKVKPLKEVQVVAGNQSATICWRNLETAAPHTEQVVEWYPQGLKLEELRWVRLGGDENSTVITGLKPFQCYEGAVYVLYNDRSVRKTRFTGVATLESVPAAGPSVQEQVMGNKVNVSWIDVGRGQRGGCITYYTIYLEKSSEDQQTYSVPASEWTHIISDLSPAVYQLWVTASTAKGEGPAGQVIKFFIQQEPQLSLLVGTIFAVIGMFLLLLIQCPAVKQRLKVFFPCFMLDNVPDPANCKWAKECGQEKGKMKLHLQPSSSSVTEEEEPILVDVEELPKQCSDPCAAPDVSSSQLPPRTSLDPQSPHIKSLSQDSESSNYTQTSLDTNTTVDYISSHGPEIMQTEEEEEEEEEEDDDFAQMMDLFPINNIMMQTLDIGGKLTLDAVKIDCSDFFQNNHF